MLFLIQLVPTEISACMYTFFYVINRTMWQFFPYYVSQVTLKFGFQVEIYRVDVELWPWGMDHGQARKMLEISTSSDRGTIKNSSQRGQQSLRHINNAATKDESAQSGEPLLERDRTSGRSSGHQWSLQAQQWGGDTQPASRKAAAEFTSQTSTQSGDPEPDFKLVGRCDLREEAKISFVRSNFSPSPLFPSSLPPPPAGCRQEELWRRGPLSLGAVTQLRLNVPFASAATALGLKTLAVWGQPARCCPPEEVERIRRAHKASQRQPPQPRLFNPSASPAEPQLDATRFVVFLPFSFIKLLKSNKKAKLCCVNRLHTFNCQLNNGRKGETRHFATGFCLSSVKPAFC